MLGPRLVYDSHHLVRVVLGHFGVLASARFVSMSLRSRALLTVGCLEQFRAIRRHRPWFVYRFSVLTYQTHRATVAFGLPQVVFCKEPNYLRQFPILA